MIHSVQLNNLEDKPDKFDTLKFFIGPNINLLRESIGTTLQVFKTEKTC